MAVGRTNEGEKRRSEGAARKFINLGGRGTLTTEASNTSETSAIPQRNAECDEGAKEWRRRRWEGRGYRRAGGQEAKAKGIWTPP